MILILSILSEVPFFPFLLAQESKFSTVHKRVFNYYFSGGSSSLTHLCEMIQPFPLHFHMPSMYAFDNSVLIKKEQSSSQYTFVFQEFSKEPMELKAFEYPCLFVCLLGNYSKLWKSLCSHLFTGKMLVTLFNLVSPASI